MKKKQILILNTCYYCGGMIVLAELCRCLVRQGYDAKLFLIYDYPQKETDLFLFRTKLLFNHFKLFIARLLVFLFPNGHFEKKYFPDYFVARHLKGCKIRYNPFFSKKNTIVVYTELVFGNPLRAQNVVRWLLFHYPYPNNPCAYKQNDLFICFREIFNNDNLNPQKKKIIINYFDHNLYKQTNFRPRFGSCYIVRKGKNRSDLPQNFNGPIIDDMTEEEKVKTFNNYEYCYSYDTQTFYSSIASICGCKSIVIMEPGKSKTDYRGEDDGESLGVAFNETPEEIRRAENSREKLIKSLDFSKQNEENTRKFIDYLEEHFHFDK